MKFIFKKHKSNFFYALLFLIFILFLIKTNFISNFTNIMKNDEKSRIVKIYGQCGGESIGYLKHLKKKFNFKTNPKIVNFVHTPQNKWAIYETISKNTDLEKIIILNYPGKEINLELNHYQDNIYELKDPYFYSTLFSSIKTLKINNFEKKIIHIGFYNKDKSNNLKKLKSLNISELNNEKNFIINQSFTDFKIDEKRFFIKIYELKKTHKLSIKLKNKYDLVDYEILDQFQNCYYIK
jgi:hypothetical protein